MVISINILCLVDNDKINTTLTKEDWKYEVVNEYNLFNVKCIVDFVTKYAKQRKMKGKISQHTRKERSSWENGVNYVSI